MGFHLDKSGNANLGKWKSESLQISAVNSD